MYRPDMKMNELGKFFIERILFFGKYFISCALADRWLIMENHFDCGGIFFVRCTRRPDLIMKTMMEIIFDGSGAPKLPTRLAERSGRGDHARNPIGAWTLALALHGYQRIMMDGIQAYDASYMGETYASS